jgi:hypothetical protein
MFASMVRRLQLFRAERRALITILNRAALKKHIPMDWKADLVRIRQSPDYKAVVQEYEATLAQLEQGADLDDLMHLFQKLSEGKPPN